MEEKVQEKLASVASIWEILNPLQPFEYQGGTTDYTELKWKYIELNWIELKALFSVEKVKTSRYKYKIINIKIYMYTE